jgi:O-methyltransferase
MIDKLYIDLLKMVLIDMHRANLAEYRPIQNNNNNSWKRKALYSLNKFLAKGTKGKFVISEVQEYNRELRVNGLDWPTYADSMIGLKRMNNIEFCFNQVIQDGIVGDFIETGVWRGGATIFMAALLKENKISDRKVWVADSFEGLPKPNEGKYIHDKGDLHYSYKELAISIDTVKENFRKYNLLGENIVFLKGWFKDTLPTAPIEKLSIIRLDGDMYESTMDGLVNLYPKLSKGGYIIIDDWGAVKGCQQAVMDYRNQNGICEEINEIDGIGVYWRKNK